MSKMSSWYGLYKLDDIDVTIQNIRTRKCQKNVITIHIKIK
jgi:hypothetical protein